MEFGREGKGHIGYGNMWEMKKKKRKTGEAGGRGGDRWRNRHGQTLVRRAVA